LRWFERVLGWALVMTPNRKLAATSELVLKLGLVNERQRRAHARAHAVFIAGYYLRFFALARARQRRAAVAEVEVRGAEHVRPLVNAGIGVVLVSVHLGDFDLGGAWLHDTHGVTPVVVDQPLTPRWRDQLFLEVRRRCGVVVRRALRTDMPTLEADIRAGRWVLAMVDRRSPGPTQLGLFLGRPVALSIGIAVLAARTRAPIIPATTWRTDSGRAVVWFGRPVTALTTQEAVHALQLSLLELEAHVRARPAQWHVPRDGTQLALDSVASRVDTKTSAVRAAA